MAKERVPNARYTKEFREETVKLIIEGGLKIPEVGRRLSIAPSTIAYWVKAHKAGKLNEVGKKHPYVLLITIMILIFVLMIKLN
jgi:transposase-like protein